MTKEEKIKLIYEYQRVGSEFFPTFEEWKEKVLITSWSDEDIEKDYNYALKAKERTVNYHKMIQDNSYVLINNGILENEIEHELSTEICKCNMDDRIERLLFVIETLKVFNIYDHNVRINDIKSIGGGYYDDGIIFGYNININNDDRYRIELTDFPKDYESDYEGLSFDLSSNKEFMNKQIEMLSKFEGFYNSDSIIGIRNKLLDAINNQKMHI